MGAVHAVVENDEEAKHGIGKLCRNFMGGSTSSGANSTDSSNQSISQWKSMLKKQEDNNEEYQV